MARLVGGTLDLSRQLLASPSRGCTAVPASSRPHPKFIVVAAHFEGARRLRGRFPGAWETLYGRLCPVPYEIIALQQPHEGQVLALLLSCPPFPAPHYTPRLRLRGLHRETLCQALGGQSRVETRADGQVSGDPYSITIGIAVRTRPRPGRSDLCERISFPKAVSRREPDEVRQSGPIVAIRPPGSSL